MYRIFSHMPSYARALVCLMWVLWACFSGRPTAHAQEEPRAKVAPIRPKAAPRGEPVVIDPNELQQKMTAAVRATPALHGAWLWIDVDNSPSGQRFKFRRLLDGRRAAEQRAQFEKLIPQWLPAGIEFEQPTEDQDELYPFSQFVEQLQNDVEGQPGLSDCLISDAFLAQTPERSAPGQLELVLVGRVGDERQKSRIGLLAEEILARDKAWYKETESTGSWLRTNISFLEPGAEAPSLAVVAPSETAARTLYDAGLRRYWTGEPVEAARYFHLASIESPRSLSYRYWRAMALLSAGDPTGTERCLTSIVRAFQVNPSVPSPEYRRALRALEPVQGPLRREFYELERIALGK